MKRRALEKIKFKGWKIGVDSNTLDMIILFYLFYYDMMLVLHFSIQIIQLMKIYKLFSEKASDIELLKHSLILSNILTFPFCNFFYHYLDTKEEFYSICMIDESIFINEPTYVHKQASKSCKGNFNYRKVREEE